MYRKGLGFQVELGVQQLRASTTIFHDILQTSITPAHTRRDPLRESEEIALSTQTGDAFMMSASTSLPCMSTHPHTLGPAGCIREIIRLRGREKADVAAEPAATFSSHHNPCFHVPFDSPLFGCVYIYICNPYTTLIISPLI